MINIGCIDSNLMADGILIPIRNRTKSLNSLLTLMRSVQTTFITGCHTVARIDRQNHHVEM